MNLAVWGVYKPDRVRVNFALVALLSFERVVVEDESVQFVSLVVNGKGINFVDVFHLALSQSADAYATIDSARRARVRSLIFSRRLWHRKKMNGVKNEESATIVRLDQI